MVGEVRYISHNSKREEPMLISAPVAAKPGELVLVMQDDDCWFGGLGYDLKPIEVVERSMKRSRLLVICCHGGCVVVLIGPVIFPCR